MTEQPLWRSVLFIPAHVERYIDSAHKRGADAIQLDLEDAVPFEAKAAARQMIPAAVDQFQSHGLDALVRINRDLRNAVADLDAAVIQGVSAICLPKAHSAAHLVLIDELITELETERHLPPGAIGLIAMIETLDALNQVEALAKATPRLTALTLGSEDFSAEGGFEPTQMNLFNPCQRLVLAAKAAGIQSYGFPGSIAEFGDLTTYRSQVCLGKSMGFDGAFCIHPAQVPVLNEVFQPSPEAIEHARQVIAAYDQALAENRGAAMLNGRMIDLPVVQRARSVLRRV